MNIEETIHPEIKLPQILLISGSGRNCGKTSLACKVINQISSSTVVIGLKISPHFHKLSHKQELLNENKNLRIYLETDIATEKDSSRMLRAGAKLVFYIQCEDKHLPQAWNELLNFLPERVAVVCESGSLALIFKPGLHLLVEGENPDKMKRSYLKNKELSDKVVRFDGKNFDMNITNISFTGNEWVLKEKQNDQVRRSA